MKYQPEVGDVGVVGAIDFITRNKFQKDWSVGGCGFFVAFVTANGYASIAQNLLVPALSFCASDIPVGIEDGDTVTADIVANEDGVMYATNIQAV